MLETIFEWITNACANLLDGLVNMFLGMLEFDLSLIVNEFPILVKAYDIFQAVGVGLVIAIAAVNLAKFYTGQTSDAKETPVAILVRALFAAALIYMGGHAVMWVIDIAKLPYDAMLSLDAVDGWVVGGSLNVEELAICVPAVIASTGLGAGVSLLASATTLLAMIMVVLIAFNVLRLIVEVCQRFLMIAVLAYSAPLVFSTAASKDTTHILQKWMSMFFGQCLLMTLSVWTLKAIVSGFAYDSAAETNYLFKFLMTLAMCKIAQRLDTYIQQLGINAATTGGNLLAEAIGAVSMLGMGVGAGRRGNGSTVLGGGMKKYMGQGLIGAIPGAFAAGKKAYETGSSVKEAVKAAAANYAKNANPFQAPKWVKETRANRKAYMDEQAKKAQEEHDKWVGKYSPSAQEANGATASNLASDAAGVGAEVNQPVNPMEDAEGYYPVLAGTGTAAMDEEGNLSWSDDFYSAGLGLETATDEDGNELSYISGDGDKVTDHVASNFTTSGDIGEEYQDVLKNTVDNSSPAVAQSILMGSEYTLAAGEEIANGTYKNDAVGSALMEKAFGSTTKDGSGVQTRVGGFTGVTAYTAPDGVDKNGNKVYNGRFADGDYVTADGQQKHLTVADQKGYDGLSAEQKAQFAPFTTDAGDTYYARISSRDGVARPEERVQNTGSSDSSYNTKVPGGYPDYKGTGAENNSPKLKTATVPEGEAGAGKKFVTGEPISVSNYLARSYTSSGDSGQEYQDALVDTVNRNPASVAENAVMHPNLNLEPGKEVGRGVYQNDQIGSAMLEKAFGNATVDEKGNQLRAGGFTNVQAVTAPAFVDESGNTIPGGRFVNADFATADGQKMHMTMTNATGYAGMSDYQKSQYKPFTSETGEQYYAKITPEKSSATNYTIPKAAAATAIRTGAMNNHGNQETVDGGLGSKTVNAPTDSRIVDGGNGAAKGQEIPVAESMSGTGSNKPIDVGQKLESKGDVMATGRSGYSSGGTGTATMNNDGTVEFDKAFSDAGLELKGGSNSQSNTGSYISGDDNTVGKHLAENFSQAGKVEGYQGVLINTAQASPVAAENALMDGKHELSGNDAVGSAYMESAFGQATIGENGEQTRQGGFTNVHAYNASGKDGTADTRFVSGEFSATDGKKTMTVTDQAGYDSLTEAQKGEYTPFNGASGEQYYKKISPADGSTAVAHIGAGQPIQQESPNANMSGQKTAAADTADAGVGHLKKQKPGNGLRTETPSAHTEKDTPVGLNGNTSGAEYQTPKASSGLGDRQVQDAVTGTMVDARETIPTSPEKVSPAADAPVKIGANAASMEQPMMQKPLEQAPEMATMPNNNAPANLGGQGGAEQVHLESNGTPAGHADNAATQDAPINTAKSDSASISDGNEGESVEIRQPVHRIGVEPAGKDLPHEGSATLGDRDTVDVNTESRDRGVSHVEGRQTSIGHEGHNTEGSYISGDSAVAHADKESAHKDSHSDGDTTEENPIETRQPMQKIGSVGGEEESISEHSGGSTLGNRDSANLNNDDHGQKGYSRERHGDSGSGSYESSGHESGQMPETPPVAASTPTPAPVQTPTPAPAQTVVQPQEPQIIQTPGTTAYTKQETPQPGTPVSVHTETTPPRAAAVSAAASNGDASARPVAGTKTPTTTEPEKIKVEQVERRVQEDRYAPESKGQTTRRSESSSVRSPASTEATGNRRSNSSSQASTEKRFDASGSSYGEDYSEEHEDFHVLDASNMRGTPGKQSIKKFSNNKNKKNKNKR